ncbi:MAG TPA: zinc ribbon domain-containing protein [Rudaea sp.]|nr:zinc ribbon domain-containing protein [Rudaea sp.]
MSSCPQCGTKVVSGSHTCPGCGASVPVKGVVSAIFTHIPHPHIALRKERAPFKRRDMLPHDNAVQRFNSLLAVKITGAVGTMWCAYLFAMLALVSLPEAVRGGTAPLIAWIAQTFLQLVLLSIIIVGQKVDGAASDKRALDTYNDAEAVLHEAMQIQEHLAAQDKVLTDLIDRLQAPKPA